MQVVLTPDAPIPAGHYSQAIVHNGLVYVAGQLPRAPGDAEVRAASVEEQAEQVLRNLEAVLVAAGSGMKHLLQVTVYVSDIALWGRVNEIYARHMGVHRPARAIVPVKELHHGYALEVQAIAAVAGPGEGEEGP